MKVTYTLTWEEFAEQHRDSWPRPNWLALAITILIAIPLLGYGIALTWFGLAGETLVGWLFIGMPLFLVFSALLSVTLEASKIKKRAVAEKRQEFERWYSAEQSFTFDQEKWTHETEAGSKESPWSALLVAFELPHIFHLTGEMGAVLVPKRVLDESTLTSLRRIALPVRGDGWTFQARCWDHQAVETVLLWRKRWFFMAFGNIFALVVLGWIVQTWLSQGAQPGLIWGWILAAFAIVLVLTAQVWYLPLHYVTSPKPWRLPMKLELSEAGIHFAASWADFFVAWKTFPKFKQTRRAFLVYTQESHYYLLPKRYITAEQQTEFRRMLTQKLKSG